MSRSELLGLTRSLLFVSGGKLLRLPRLFLLMSRRVVGRSLRKHCRGHGNRRDENPSDDFHSYHVLLRFEMAVTFNHLSRLNVPEPECVVTFLHPR